MLLYLHWLLCFRSHSVPALNIVELYLKSKICYFLQRYIMQSQRASVIHSHLNLHRFQMGIVDRLQNMESNADGHPTIQHLHIGASRSTTISILYFLRISITNGYCLAEHSQVYYWSNNETAILKEVCLRYIFCNVITSTLAIYLLPLRIILPHTIM